MKLLALDTSSDACSVALLDGSDLGGHFRVEPRGHTRLIMPMVRQLLEEQGVAMADLDALAFAAGPGSFTGLRIATGVIQGLAWGLDIPVVPVSSLQAVALAVAEGQDAREGDGIAVAFDARMDEVYWGCYRMASGLPVLLATERVCPPEQVSLPEGPARWLAGGGGWRYAERMPESVTAVVATPSLDSVPDARFVARLAAEAWKAGNAVPAAEAQPVYLRDEVTWKKLPGR
ncbi:tRNA (adenosine(37)-N6)-threonylcarbamoyltransferase complex dimerization subunit type 1 TsaB [Marinobacter bryozoorum]|uniref:tRNA (adenosine(37)-N6)-threonylcarbamoyltransferase complex dimerization subunit type 1 TsaB n=1 Tax=Marinobacter bryozoorum TaxID=256324 RepID=UPI0020040374|nr:tRNA (adenosine(37)-N6)-threonylcarbamoyltransferase complex dimerization subunit type 1 TsaB [Marinobacter bryozoorum]MCK7544452.1 tRNA (adenosine(37)-N6)-threonylcarbamoyltransferase complex dimerization subunit type 1 TsaB [Marinobacter bryozoorum]